MLYEHILERLRHQAKYLIETAPTQGVRKQREADLTERPLRNRAMLITRVLSQIEDQAHRERLLLDALKAEPTARWA